MWFVFVVIKNDIFVYNCQLFLFFFWYEWEIWGFGLFDKQVSAYSGVMKKARNQIWTGDLTLTMGALYRLSYPSWYYFCTCEVIFFFVFFAMDFRENFVIWDLLDKFGWNVYIEIELNYILHFFDFDESNCISGRLCY